MDFLVVYFSRGGKTKKVAEAITKELGCEAIDANKKTPDISGVDLLIVGSGNYGSKPGEPIQKFLENIQPTSNQKAAVFATTGGPDPKCVTIMKETLQTKGYTIVSSFYCPGKFLFANRGRPNADDLKNAQAFARELKNL
ncbi:MAG: flavodoxin domain-containing protein [Candidatus Bathyarchaeia archaeon]|jgi:flavodoxin I